MQMACRENLVKKVLYVQVTQFSNFVNHLFQYQRPPASSSKKNGSQSQNLGFETLESSSFHCTFNVPLMSAF